MPAFEKHFTLEEARGHLPELRRQFARIQELLTVLQLAQGEMERVLRLIQSNGHGSNHPDYGAEIKELQERVADITGQGIEIKNLAQGLVDFPHWRDGEEVYLCWLYGEDDIRYWHTLEGGFAGRRPL
jgi:hypothetical protein